MKGRATSLTLSLVAAIALASTVDARPTKRNPSRTTRTTPRFHGKRVPSSKRLIERQAPPKSRVRRGRRGRPAPPPPPPPHRASVTQMTSSSGKLAIASFSSLQWKTGGLYLAGASYGQLDFAVKETGGKHVMLTCDVNPSKEDMLLLLTRPDGTTITRALEKRGHQFVNFSIPSAPEAFEFSLQMAGGPNDVLAQAWVFYGCTMELK